MNKAAAVRAGARVAVDLLARRIDPHIVNLTVDAHLAEIADAAEKDDAAGAAGTAVVKLAETLAASLPQHLGGKVAAPDATPPDATSRATAYLKQRDESARSITNPLQPPQQGTRP